MVIDKPYSNHLKSELIDYFWSGKHHKTVKGINIITIYYTDVNEISVPINYRIINKQERKTKHEYFLEMLKEIKQWGLFPSKITGDSWYGKKETLKFFKDKGQSFLFAIKSNRQVSQKNKKFVSVKDLEIPEEGLIVYLKEFGTVKVFKKMFKNEYRYYAIWSSNSDELNEINRETFNSIHDKHWTIEQYHRALKQVCNPIEISSQKNRGNKNPYF